MPKRVFFSFHYQDVIDFRANVVRNHWVTKLNREDAGYFDASIWESAKRQGDLAIKRLINSGMEYTSVTCVLIGSETYNRRWVKYEIMKSLKRGNSLFGVHINCIKGRDGQIKNKGLNPFEYLGLTYAEDGNTATLWEKVNGDWITYGEVDGSTLVQTENISEYNRGKGFNLTTWYPSYDWYSDDGYNNFAKWADS